MIVSVPCELNKDHMAILESAQATGFVTISGLTKTLQWDKQRFDTVLNLMLQEGMIWIDLQSGEPEYWFPSLFAKWAEHKSLVS